MGFGGCSVGLCVCVCLFGFFPENYIISLIEFIFSLRDAEKHTQVQEWGGHETAAGPLLTLSSCC